MQPPPGKKQTLQPHIHSPQPTLIISLSAPPYPPYPSASAREHLRFYGRLKNLSGLQLDRAVDRALLSVSLHANKARVILVSDIFDSDVIISDERVWIPLNANMSLALCAV